MTAHQMGLASCLLVLGLGVPAQAETLTVTTTADSGPGSLREQITAANATAEKDVIAFDVAGTIRLVSPLPQITQPLEMDGEGAIEIDGTDVDAAVFALDIQHTSECVIEGMTIRGFDAERAGGIRIQGDAFDNVIANNILAGNLFGVLIAEGPEEPGRNRIEGNYIDAEAGALAPVPGEWHQFGDLRPRGITVAAASGNVIAENWVFRTYRGINVVGDASAGGYVRGQANKNQVVRNKTFFTGNQGLVVASDASDNTLSGNEVYYAGREGIEVTGNGLVANRNVVTENVIVGNGRNGPRFGAILVLDNANENIVTRNEIRDARTPGLMVQDNASGNVFEENEIDGSDGYGILLVGAALFPHLPGTGPVAQNRFERNVVTNTRGAVGIQGDAVGNLFRENIFGAQAGPIMMDGDQSPEAPGRVVANNRFEKNVHKDVDGLPLWSFTHATRDNTICGFDLPRRLPLDVFLRFVTPEGLGNVVVPYCDDEATDQSQDREDHE